MSMSIPQTMKAAAIDRFGGPEDLHLQPLPVPKPGANELPPSGRHGRDRRLGSVRSSRAS